MDLNAIPRYALVMLIALAIGGVAGWRTASSRADARVAAVQSKWDAERAATAIAARAAEADARRVEQRRQDQVDEVTKNAQAQIDQAHAAVAAANRAADGLRRELSAFTARHRSAGHPGAPGSGPGQQGADPLDLLAELFARSDAASGELASYADRIRIAGQACERSYDALRAAR